MLKRENTERSHIYEAAIPKKETQMELLNRFLHSAFGGSSLSLVLRALGSKSTTQEDLVKIREYLDKIEGKKKSYKRKIWTLKEKADDVPSPPPPPPIK